MKLELTQKNIEMLDKRYPMLKKVADAIHDVMGVSLEDMRSRSHMALFNEARACFWALCKYDIQPIYIVSSYLNRSHACSANWDKYYEQAIKYNTSFKDLIHDIKYKLSEK